MSERSYDLLAKIIRAVPKRSEGELKDVVGEEFMRLNEDNVSEFQKQKASGALPTKFPKRGYPKRRNLVLVWDMEELYSTGLPDQNQQVSIVVVSAMLAVRWLVRPIIDLLTRDIWWFRALHHIAIVNTLRTWW